MSTIELENEIERLKIYHSFWASQRHLPRATESATYFYQRINELEQKLKAKKEHDQQNHTTRQCGERRRAKDD